MPKNGIRDKLNSDVHCRASRVAADLMRANYEAGTWPPITARSAVRLAASPGQTKSEFKTVEMSERRRNRLPGNRPFSPNPSCRSSGFGTRLGAMLPHRRRGCRRVRYFSEHAPSGPTKPLQPDASKSKRAATVRSIRWLDIGSGNIQSPAGQTRGVKSSGKAGRPKTLQHLGRSEQAQLMHFLNIPHSFGVLNAIVEDQPGRAASDGPMARSLDPRTVCLSPLCRALPFL